jgi:hypothetical protein
MNEWDNDAENITELSILVGTHILVLWLHMLHNGLTKSETVTQ